METSRSELKKKSSQNSNREPSPDRKTSSTPTNKLKTTRANSFKDAPISHFLYHDQQASEEPGKELRKESKFKPSETQGRKRIMSDVIDNPFLRARHNFIEKNSEKQGKKVKFESPFDEWKEEEVVFDKERVSFRSIRQELERKRLERQNRQKF